MLQLEPLLRGCALASSKDPADAVAAIKAQLLLQSDAVGTSDELFATAARRWVDQKDAGVTSFRFLLLVIACRWERLLMQLLLQHHARDAADDMSALLPVCLQLLESSAAKLALPVLDALLTVGASFTLACPRGSGDENDTDSFLYTQLRSQAKRCPTCSRSDLPLLESVITEQGKRQTPSKESSWTRFLRHSWELDARRFDSKSGRTLSSAIARVAGQQQRALTLVRLRHEASNELFDAVNQEASLRVGMDKMQELASQVLHIVRVCDEDSVCERCAGKPELGSQPRARTSFSGDDGMDLIPDDAALESFLMRKANSVDAEEALQRRRVIADEDKTLASVPETESTCFKKLLEVVNTQAVPSVSDAGDLVQKTQEELSRIAHLDVLAIQISFLLAAQLQSKRYVFDLDDAVGASLKRQVLREFNSLTDGADTGRSVRTLLVLAGLCPSLILCEIVSRAMVAPQHVQIYAEILELCPILFEWKDEGSESPVLIRELQSTLRDVVSAEHSFDVQQTHLLELLCALAGLSENTSTTGHQKSAAVDVHTLIRDVIVPVHDSISLQQTEDCSAADSATRAAILPATSYFLFVSEFVRCAVAKTRWRSTSSGIRTTKKLFALLVSVYQKHCGSLANQIIGLRNTLLLTMKDLLEFIAPLQQAKVSDIVKASIGDVVGTLDEPALMLIAHVAPDTCDWMPVREELATLRRLSQELGVRPAIEESVIDLDQASHVVRLLLWKLLWSSASPSNTFSANASPNQSFLSAERVWKLLELLANRTVSDATAGEADREVTGRAIVRKELAHLMLMCRTSLFASLIDGVLPRLVPILEQQTLGAALVELKLPKQLFAPLLDAEDSEAAHPACELPASHSVVKFVSRSWSLLVLSSDQSDEDAVESGVELQMARHFLVVCDRAVSDSKSSLVGLLHCFQWVCYMLCGLSCESRVRDLESCGSIRSQLGVSLIRLLHLLSQTQLAKHDDASFSQHFVASWMAQLPPDSFEQACNFVSSARD